MEYVTLNNGIKMPKLGYGVYQLSNEECERCVLDAISAGYRSIDTAQSYGNEEAVQHESWGPFAEERKDFFTNPVLNEIGKKHDKSAAQVALRFLLQSDVVVIPKSTHKERMEENINVFDFALDASDMNAIRALDEKESLFFSHYDPAIAEMMIKLH